MGGEESRLPAPGGPSSPDDALAGRWLLALEALAARSAHALNNALNGATVNLEVVKLRARPGADAAAAAPFAETAAGELERANALAGALLTLARAPRGAADVGEALRHVVALLGPVLAERGVTLVVEASRDRAPTAVPAHAVRLALVRGLLAAADALAAEPGGAEPADESVRLLRCILSLTPTATVRLAPREGAAAMYAPLDAADFGVLQAAGVGIAHAGGAFVLQFPAPDAAPIHA